MSGLLGPTPANGEERMMRIKTELHQKLISEMDLSAMGSMSEEELREEVRRGAEQLCRQQHIRETVLFKAAQQGPRI